MDLQKIIEDAKAYAGDTVEEYKLKDFVNSSDLAWEVLDLVSKDKDFAPFVIGAIEDKKEAAIAKKRTDIKTIKLNSDRRVCLVKWLRDEVQPYEDFYKAELEILNAYAIQAIVDFHKVNPGIVDYFNKLLREPHRKRV